MTYNVFFWDVKPYSINQSLSLKSPSHIKCVATLPCEMISGLKATIENKTSEVKPPTLIVTKFFLNKQNL